MKNAILFALMTMMTSSQNATLASIEGVVIELGTGKPVDGAVVDLAGIITGDGVHPHTVTTKADGAFAFQNLPAAEGYWLTATHAGFSNAAFGQSELGRPGIPITLSFGRQLKSVRLEMAKTGMVHGRIVDKKGKPLENVRVEAVHPYVRDGLKVLAASDGPIELHTMTNVRGEYRFTDLPPGQYYFRAFSNGVLAKLSPMELDSPCSERPVSAASQGIAGIQMDRLLHPAEVDVPTYFPGSTNPQIATPFNLHAGADIQLGDLAIGLTPIRRVHGEVVDATTGKRVGSGKITLVPSNVAFEKMRRCTVNAAKGSFDIPSLLEGKFYLLASVDDRGGKMSGYVLVTVGSSDIQDVKIPVSRAFQIHGRVTSAGASGSENADWSDFKILLQQDRLAGIAPPALASSTRDGSFVLDGITHWNYKVSVEPSMGFPSAYVQSIRLGSRDVLNDGLEIESPTSEELQVVIRTDGVALAGRVVSPVQDSVANATMVMVPSPANPQRKDLYKVARTDTLGNFQLQGIMPGDYKLFAWGFLEGEPWMDPEFMKLIEDRGSPVRVNQGDRAHVDVRLCPPWY